MANSGVIIAIKVFFITCLAEKGLYVFTGLEPAPTRAGRSVSSSGLVMRAVNFVDWNATSGFVDLNADELAFVTDKLFPAVSAAVAGINCARKVVDKEDPKMPIGLASSSKGSAVLGEVNDVVNPDFVNIDRTHGTPPSNLYVVRTATRGVNPWRRAPAPPLTTLAANTPATERVSSWVKFIRLFVIDVVLDKTGNKEIATAGITTALAIYR